MKTAILNYDSVITSKQLFEQHKN